MSHYQETLYHIIHENRMYGYEENNMAFITSKLINLNKDLDRPLSLIIRSDYIVDDTYWLIRYFRSRQVEPAYLLSTSSVKQEFGYFLGIPQQTGEICGNCVAYFPDFYFVFDSKHGSVYGGHADGI